MTTKPDGWVAKNYRDFVRLGCWFSFRPKKPEHPATDREYVPVCLVPPALLDWCEEVEKFFQDELKWGMIEDPESVKKLLNKLKEVRG